MSPKRLPTVVPLCLALALISVPFSLEPLQATTWPVAGPPEASAQADTQLQSAYGQLPLLFVENLARPTPRSPSPSWAA